MKRRRLRNLLRGLILSFAVAAIVVPAAQARVSNYNPSGQSEQSQSITDINQIQRQLEAQRIQSLIKQEEREKAAASRRPDDKAGLRGPGTVDARTVESVSVKGDGFSWSDAGIGAGAAIALLLVLMSGLVLMRRHRSELAV
jgi:hypothetical protein